MVQKKVSLWSIVSVAIFVSCFRGMSELLGCYMKCSAGWDEVDRLNVNDSLGVSHGSWLKAVRSQRHVYAKTACICLFVHLSVQRVECLEGIEQVSTRRKSLLKHEGDVSQKSALRSFPELVFLRGFAAAFSGTYPHESSVYQLICF